MKTPILIITSILFVMLSSCAKPTIACFTFSPNPVAVNTTVTFDGSCSQNTFFFEWDFGDGSYILTSNSETTYHQFTAPGSYNITLSAIRKDGFTLGKDYPEKTQTIIVQ